MKKNITKLLHDKHAMPLGRIAYLTGAHFNTVHNWFVGWTKPDSRYQLKLERILKRQEKETPCCAAG